MLRGEGGVRREVRPTDQAPEGAVSPDARPVLSFTAKRRGKPPAHLADFPAGKRKEWVESDEAHYGEAAKRLTIKAARAAERRKELKQHEKNVRTGKKKPHQEEPQPAPAAKAKSAEKSESKRPRGAVKHGRTRAEREKAHRAAEKQRAARRFAHSRPVKKGKGSIKKDSKQRSQHTEVQ